MTGHTIGHYQILNRLGENGMGVVYLAGDTNSGRQVAIKLLREIFA
jgi:serine/threonine protein kinase